MSEVEATAQVEKTAVAGASSPDNASSTKSIEADPNHLSGFRLGLTLFALCIAVFCGALDNTIIATAIPRITDEFRAIEDIGWYGSAYLLTTCAFTLFFGKLYTLLSTKWVFLGALLVFEVGSVVCGAAPTSVALIIGRAIAGIGSAGVFSGSLVICADITPIEKRALYNSLLASMFGVSSVVGPLMGGAFTDNVTWRWCFYINLPIGAVTAFIVVLFLHLNSSSKTLKDMSLRETLWRLDPIGLLLFIPSVVCLLIALQWGETTYPWNSGRIIALLVVFGIALIAFIVSQAWLGEIATIPPHIGTQRTVWASSLFMFCLSSGFFLLIYFLPIYFQAVHGMTALRSGIASIPLIFSNVVAMIMVGILVTKLGWYMPFVFISIVLVSIAAGLITTLEPSTGSPKWIGYQILYGFGVGCAYGIPQLATQAILPIQEVPTGLAIIIFFQFFGPAVLLGAGNNVLNDKLRQYIAEVGIANIDPSTVVSVGATEIRKVVPVEHLDQVIGAYNHALVQTFRVALIMSCLGVLGGVFMEWKSIKTSKDEKKDAESQ